MGEDGKPQYLISVIKRRTDRKRSEQPSRTWRTTTRSPICPTAPLSTSAARTIDLAAVAKDQFACCAWISTASRTSTTCSATPSATRCCARSACACRRPAKAPSWRASVRRICRHHATGRSRRRRGAGDGSPRARQRHPRRGSRAAHRVTVGVAVYPQDGADGSTLVPMRRRIVSRQVGGARLDPLLRSGDGQTVARQAAPCSRTAPGDLARRARPALPAADADRRQDDRFRGAVPGITRRTLVPPGVFIRGGGKRQHRCHRRMDPAHPPAREAAAWPNPLHIASNLSRVQFQHGDLVGMVHRVLLETGLRPAAGAGKSPRAC